MITHVIPDVPAERLPDITQVWAEQGFEIRQIAPQAVATTNPDGLSHVRLWTVVLAQAPF